MRFIFTAFFILFLSFFVSAQKKRDYFRFIDSADFYISEDAYKSLQFLDSIPLPIENFIEGKLGKFHFLRAHAYDREKEQNRVFQNYLLSIRFAKKEKDFVTAGDASLGMFSDLYWIKRDTSAYKYLRDAETFYTLAKAKYKLLEVNQMPAYISYLESDYQKSIDMVLEKLDEYKKVDHDAYYYLFAIYLLTSNNIYLNNKDEVYKYLYEYKQLESNPTLNPYNYYGYGSNLQLTMAKSFLDKKEIDSTLSYLNSVGKLKKYMSISSTGHYYSYYTEVYNLMGDDERSNNYLDSLKIFQNKVLDDNIEASLELNTILLNSEELLKKGSEKSRNQQYWLALFGVVLLGFILLIIFGYKNFKTRLKDFIKQKRNLTELETTHEKLKVKTHELEKYIGDLKSKVKHIATIEDKSTQRDSIRGLYRTINAESSNIENSEKLRIEVLKELNSPFFKNIEENHPDLSDIEYLICYYLKLGFKNKEIAFFLDRTIRSIESQRYRISKKMNLDNSKFLFDYLSSNY